MLQLTGYIYGFNDKFLPQIELDAKQSLKENQPLFFNCIGNDNFSCLQTSGEIWFSDIQHLEL